MPAARAGVIHTTAVKTGASLINHRPVYWEVRRDRRIGAGNESLGYHRSAAQLCRKPRRPAVTSDPVVIVFTISFHVLGWDFFVDPPVRKNFDSML